MKTSEQINEVAAALAAAQGELADTPKDQSGYGYKYADLAGVHKIARPVLAKHGLAVVQDAAVEGVEVLVATRICHQSGQWLEVGPLRMEAEPKKGLSHAQCVGSVVTYARRYALTALLQIAGEDDDGTSAAEHKPRKRRQPEKAEEPQAPDVSQILGSIQTCIKANDPATMDVLSGLSMSEKQAVWGQLTEAEQTWVRNFREENNG